MRTQIQTPTPYFPHLKFVAVKKLYGMVEFQTQTEQTELV